MTKVETAFFRKGKQILGLDNDGGQILIETFPSINAAKNWSRKQQEANGGVGMGYVRVIKKEKVNNKKLMGGVGMGYVRVIKKEKVN